MSHYKLLSQSGLLSIALSLALNSFVQTAFAQITPNGAGTVVNPQGNQINITGGTQAGANLFHSFRDFNVNSAQVANFLSNPQIQNILARVNGGNPSMINGLLQVTGGNSNLFLMNPAGIVFGQGASLNVPASFTATTANQIGFGNNLFNAVGDNNFSALIGNPDSFIFTTNQAGSIVNAGNLAVSNGQNISLISGNTINTGRLTAPGGEIQVLAVPGTNRVRLSQPGQVLSLEIVPPVDGVLRAIDLPALLTGNDLPGIQVNPSGQVQIAGTSLPNQQGLAIASGVIDVSSTTGNGGTVQVLGNRVAALNSRINANGATGGGTVRLGGEYLGGRDTGIAPAMRFNSQRTLVDRNSLIRANATVSGDGGRVIVWADQDTGYFGRITGRGATGRGGFVEVSGRENLAFDGRVEIPGATGLFGTLLLDPTNITIGAIGTDDGQLADATILSGDTPANMFISAAALAAIPATTAINITATNNIDFQSDLNLTGGISPAAVSFNADNITSGTFTINSGGRNLVMTANTINAPNLTVQSFNIPAPSSGNIRIIANQGEMRLASVSSGDRTPVPNLPTNAGSIDLYAQGNIAATTVASTSNAGNGGAVNITSQGGNITATNIYSRGNNGNGGAVNLTARGNITNNATESTGAGLIGSTFAGGNINFTAQGNIVTSSGIGGVSASGSTLGSGGSIIFNVGGSITAPNGLVSRSGLISLNAQGDITTGQIIALSISSNRGGTVNINSTQGNIQTGAISTAGTVNAPGGGNINVIAPQGNITTGSLVSQGQTPGSNGGSISIIGGGLVRITGTVATCDVSPASAICSNGSGGVDGPITINHGGGLNTPFIIGNATINGTAGSINSANSPYYILAPQPILASPSGITVVGNITFQTPVPIPIPQAVLSLLTNPPAPTAPAPIISGIPPTPEPSPEPFIAPASFPSPAPNPIDTSIVPIIPILPPTPEPFLFPVIPRFSLNLPLSLRDVLSRNGTVQNGLATSLSLSDYATSIVSSPSAEYISGRLGSLEDYLQAEFAEYLNINPNSLSSGYNLTAVQNKLNEITAATGSKPALLYVFFASQDGSNNFGRGIDQTNSSVRENDSLEVIAITGQGKAIRVQLSGTTRRQVMRVANEFRSEVTNFRSSRGFLSPAQKMHQWILGALEEELQKQGIDNLVFLVDTGLRSIPLAAMHDGTGFIVEKYSVALMPSLNLVKLRYDPLQDAQVLAMGATTFSNSGLQPLPAVSLELNTVSQLWQGTEFLNDRFTLNNLIQQRQNQPFRMIHLATHAVFNPGDRSNSFIQFWDQRLSLNQLDQFNWGNPPVDLLVLSACQTALGDREAELGFAGLSINAGVRSALASLWQVNDLATLGLMTKFYQQLQNTTTKAEALRQAQLAMLKGEVRLEDGNLVLPSGVMPLTEELQSLGNLRLNHPYYWSAFTLVGNPW